MLSDVEEGNNLTLTRLTPVATLGRGIQEPECRSGLQPES